MPLLVGITRGREPAQTGFEGCLLHGYPRLAMKDMPWDEDDGKPARRQVFAYKGVDSYTRKWTDCYAYGGLWAENVTQAVARDIMADAIKRLEAAGYPVILSVHDEVVSVVPEAFGSVDEFCTIMTELPAWAAGCPVEAEGWEGPRYKK
jgi:DNA polymerase